jgi:Spy/CpxP family protein refolding chaperone
MPVSRFVPPIAPIALVALIAAFGAPFAAGAQTAPPQAPPADSTAPMPSAHHHHHRESIVHALRAVKNLTPSQQQQIAAFRDQEKKANANADPETKRANAAKMRDQIMGILTPDQKTQLSTEMHRPHGPANSDASAPDDGPMPGGGAMPRPAPSPASQ